MTQNIIDFLKMIQVNYVKRHEYIRRRIFIERLEFHLAKIFHRLLVEKLRELIQLRLQLKRIAVRFYLGKRRRHLPQLVIAVDLNFINLINRRLAAHYVIKNICHFNNRLGKAERENIRYQNFKQQNCQAQCKIFCRPVSRLIVNVMIRTSRDNHPARVHIPRIRNKRLRSVNVKIYDARTVINSVENKFVLVANRIVSKLNNIV